MKTLVIALRVSLVTLVLTGLVYPLVVTAAAQLVFPAQSQGSLVRDDRGRVVGSELVGQRFTAPGYFWSRPSATGDRPYDAANSMGSNAAPTSQKLHQRVAEEIARLQKANPAAHDAVPDDLVTTSASGLDPHISPAAARWQAPRVAAARGIGVERVLAIVEPLVEGRELGFLGEPRVDVLRLNLALDRQFGSARTAATTAEAP